LYKVVLFDLVQQKRYTSSKILVVVTQVRPSFLPDLINMTPTTIAPSDTQMPGSDSQQIPPTIFNPTDDDDDDAPPSSGPTGDDVTEEDDVSTVVPTNEPEPLDVIKYNIKLLMTNKQDNSDSELQQATMTVFHRISEDFGSDVCILDGTGNPMTDFKIQAISTFCSQFHVGRNKGNPKYKRSPSAWLIFTIQSTERSAVIRGYPVYWRSIPVD
jgi:hypothetical protein